MQAPACGRELGGGGKGERGTSCVSPRMTPSVPSFNNRSGNIGVMHRPLRDLSRSDMHICIARNNPTNNVLLLVGILVMVRRIRAFSLQHRSASHLRCVAILHFPVEDVLPG